MKRGMTASRSKRGEYSRKQANKALSKRACFETTQNFDRFCDSELHQIRKIAGHRVSANIEHRTLKALRTYALLFFSILGVLSNGCYSQSKRFGGGRERKATLR